MDTLCRVCIKRAVKCISLNSKIEDSSDLSFLGFLNKCTSLNARESDSLPQNLCSICANSLKSFYAFVKLAEKSDIVLKVAWKNLIAKGRYNGSGEISGEKTVRNDEIEEESEDFNQRDSFHYPPTRNSTESKYCILDHVKEERRLSESTSIVDLKDTEINENENFESNADHPKGSLDILSGIDRRLPRIGTENTDSEDEIPISLFKRKLGKNEGEADSQSNSLTEACYIPSNVKKKTGKIEAKGKNVIKEEPLDPPSIHGSGGQIDNNEIHSEEITIRNEKVEEDFKDFNKEDSFHCQLNKNSTESSLYILEIVKEEPRLSEGTSIDDLKDDQINASGHFEANLKYLERSIEEPDDISLLKSRLAKNEDEADSQTISCEETTTSNKAIGHGCETCGKIFSTKYYLNVHLEHHKGITHKCDQCGKEYNNSLSLKIHMKWHANPNQYACENCGKFFAWKNNYNRHMDICKRPGEPKKLNTTKVECNICGKKFCSKQYLNFHMESHAGITLQCDQCNKECRNSRSLRRHMKWHANSKSFKWEKCEICDKKFSTKECLNRHMQNHKGIIQKCDQCDKEFDSIYSLRRHMKWHNNLQPLKGEKCDQCNKKFESIHTLRIHMKLHTNPKLFKCERCGKLLASKHSFISHLDFCKRRGKPQKAECGICGKVFRRKDYLTLHMKKHKGITQKCDQCDKEFENIYSLRRHLKWHADPTPFKCENCEKLFAWKHNYASHMRICKPVGYSLEETLTIEKQTLHPEGNKDIVVTVT